MSAIVVGKPLPDFTLAATGNEAGSFRLRAARGATLVLYFYPRDNTPRAGGNCRPRCRWPPA